MQDVKTGGHRLRPPLVPFRTPPRKRTTRRESASTRAARWLSLTLTLLATGAGCVDSETADAGGSVADRWAAARALWHIERDPAAFAAWTSIEESSPEGQEAARLLREAAPRYRHAIEQVRTGEPGARESFERAVRIAPMDPDLYLPLARAFRGQAVLRPDNPHLFIRAAEYYRKFLVLSPDATEADAARRELSAIDPAGSRLFEPPGVTTLQVDGPVAAPAPASAASWPLYVAFAALALAIAAMTVLALRPRPARLPLLTLAERRPELHPAITYLVGSLRHELLKHRIGAVGNAVTALGRGDATPSQMEFLRHRLFGGEPLPDAWEGFLRAFERALGPDLDLRRRDRAFRRAGRAIARIAALEPRLRRAEPRAIEGLRAAHHDLRALDAHLSEMVQRLVRTKVDGALFREVVDTVRGEYAAGQVALEEVVIRAPEPPPMVEVFRVDLVLVLKNVVRNAIASMGPQDPPRRLGLDVSCEVEPTGEETVRIHVRDTSPERVTTEDIYARRMDRGLGLVTAALSRYDGAIAVEDGDAEWAKVVVVRFFRAYAEDEP